jgi:hypothetical protein
MSVSKQPLQHNTDERQQKLVENQRIFVDFHNADAQGRLRLNCIGTIEDLSAQKIGLHSGQKLTFYSEDLEVNGVVEYSDLEHIWVAIVDWNEIKQIEEVNPVQKRFFHVEKHRVSTGHMFGKLPDEAKRDLKNSGVLRDLALLLMDEPELRQNIEQKGFDLEEIINMVSQEGEPK